MQRHVASPRAAAAGGVPPMNLSGPAIEELVEWLHSLAPWDTFATMTFAERVNLHAARLHWKHFMSDARFDGTSYFAAFEPNPGRPGWHIHALLCHLRVKRREMWQQWFSAFGRNRIEPVNCKLDVLSYCAKYVTKCPDGWWDLHVDKRTVAAHSARRSPRNVECPLSSGNAAGLLEGVPSPSVAPAAVTGLEEAELPRLLNLEAP